jgi:hypothetical protein
MCSTSENVFFSVHSPPPPPHTDSLQNAEEPLLLLFFLTDPPLRCYLPLLLVAFIRHAEPSCVTARKHLYFYFLGCPTERAEALRLVSRSALTITQLRQVSIDKEREAIGAGVRERCGTLSSSASTSFVTTQLCLTS